MPDLSHLWQRFVLATALIFGLALGVGATVFGYSNTAPVNIGWSIFHLNDIPLWTVALVPLVVVLVAGTIYHWFNSLHHFTEHMRHRRRVHELEAEVTRLRAHLDQLLDMPDHEKAAPTAGPEIAETAPALLAEPVAGTSPMNGGDRPARKTARMRDAQPVTETEPVAVAAPAETTAETEPREETPAEA